MSKTKFLEEQSLCLAYLKSLGCEITTTYESNTLQPIWWVRTPPHAPDCAITVHAFKSDEESLEAMRRLCEELDRPRRRSERIAQVIG